MNLVALNPANHNVMIAKAYDTYGRTEASSDLARDLNGLRRGSIVVVSVKDSAENISEEVKEAFHAMGSQEILSLGHREAWGFIAVKGQQGAQERRDKYVEMGIILGYAKRVKVKRTKEEIAADNLIHRKTGKRAKRKPPEGYQWNESE